MEHVSPQRDKEKPEEFTNHIDLSVDYLLACTSSCCRNKRGPVSWKTELCMIKASQVKGLPAQPTRLYVCVRPICMLKPTSGQEPAFQLADESEGAGMRPFAALSPLRARL